MKAYSVLALFAAVVLADDSDATALISANEAYATCAMGSKFQDCQSSLFARDPCTQTKEAELSSCSCAYASTAISCMSICTTWDTNVLNIATGCPDVKSAYSHVWSSMTSEAAGYSKTAGSGYWPKETGASGAYNSESGHYSSEGAGAYASGSTWAAGYGSTTEAGAYPTGGAAPSKTSNTGVEMVSVAGAPMVTGFMHGAAAIAAVAGAAAALL